MNQPSGGAAGEDPDVFLDVPAVKVDEVQIEVDELRADVSLHAAVLDVLSLGVGADVSLGRVNLTLRGVEAQAMLKVRLDNVAQIIDRVLATVDANPELLARAGSGAAEAARAVEGPDAGRALPRAEPARPRNGPDTERPRRPHVGRDSGPASQGPEHRDRGHAHDRRAEYDWRDPWDQDEWPDLHGRRLEREPRDQHERRDRHGPEGERERRHERGHRNRRDHWDEDERPSLRGRPDVREQREDRREPRDQHERRREQDRRGRRDHGDQDGRPEARGRRDEREPRDQRQHGPERPDDLAAGELVGALTRKSVRAGRELIGGVLKRLPGI
ncbi:hypothetical protein [Actinomadura verrucosospora]|uniref:Putative Rhs protein n=1 Tax=Actinomadura verrucosospora TaxID=46165 RepID=A0A7D4ALJ3_ACTVE|nr:hypothetical protein [Actinomadura verrucosospora]QKG21408.1 putative Rhs protein [Actinomadura verrucosospora]